MKLITMTIVLVLCCLFSLTKVTEAGKGGGVEDVEAINSGFTCGPNLVANSGPIVVDGDLSDWESIDAVHTSDDFFADMHRAGSTKKIIESHLYMRYDCENRRMYIMVHTVDGVTFHGTLDSDNFYIKFKGPNPFSGGSGKPDGFNIVFNTYDTNSATFFEADFLIPAGYTGGSIQVHAQVLNGGSQTSATATNSNSRLIPLTISDVCSDCTHEMVTKRVSDGEIPMQEYTEVECASDCRDYCFQDGSCYDYLYYFETDVCQLFSSAVDPSNWIDSEVHLSGNCRRDSASPVPASQSPIPASQSPIPPSQSPIPASPSPIPASASPFFSLPALPSQSSIIEPSTLPFEESLSPSASAIQGSFDDPLIRGFNGQSFYFSGSLHDVYNLVTSKHLQINMRIISHEGMWKLNSWMGEIGIASYGHTVSFNNNSEAFLDGRPCPEDRYINVNDNFEVKYSAKNGSLDVTIDKSIKMAIRVHSNDWTKFKSHLDLSFKGDITSLGMLHGVLGQTAYKEPLDDRHQHEENIQGEGIIDGEYLDYKVGKNDIFGTNFTYNLYSPEEPESGGAQRRLLSLPFMVEAHVA